MVHASFTVRQSYVLITLLLHHVTLPIATADMNTNTGYYNSPSYSREQAKKQKRRRTIKYSVIALVVVLVLVGLFSALGPTEFSKKTESTESTVAKSEAQSFAVADTDDTDAQELNAKIDLADVKDTDNADAYEENLA